MRETDVAYCAGVLDGEGTIVVNRQLKDGKRYHRIHVKVTQLDSESIDTLYETFGGSVKQTPNGYFHWYQFSTRAKNTLIEMLPYLRIKAPQAELAIAFQNDWDAHKGKHGNWTQDGERAYWALRNAKRVHRTSRYVTVQPQRLSAGDAGLASASDSPAPRDGKPRNR